MKNFLKWLWACCINGDHDWTTKAIETPLTSEGLAKGLAEQGRSFLDGQFSVYCKRCGQSHPSN